MKAEAWNAAKHANRSRYYLLVLSVPRSICTSSAEEVLLLGRGLAIQIQAVPGSQSVWHGNVNSPPWCWMPKEKTPRRYEWVRSGRRQMQQWHDEVPLCKLSLEWVVEEVE